MPSSLVGRSIHDVDTPAALLDLDVFEQNARHIASYLAASGVNWRPHVKAHKSPVLAKLAIACGASGLTCAKTAEAEVMVEAGLTDILVANHLGSAVKWRRIAGLQRSARVLVCADDPAHVRMASQAATELGVEIPLLVELDLGMRRVGVPTYEAARDLAVLVAESPGVRLDGVMGYEGHVLQTWPEERKERECREAVGLLTDTADRLRADGHAIEIVSAGGTGSFEITARIPGVTEIEAGGGCLMDLFYSDYCHVPLPHALTLLTTVVSVQTPGQAVIDAGAKALGQGAAFPFPRSIESPELAVTALSAEHGMLATGTDRMSVGQRVRLVAGYSDAMLVLHDHALGVRGDTVVDVIELTARGRLT
ncbi:alanine racemase [Microbacterium sp. MC2]